MKYRIKNRFRFITFAICVLLLVYGILAAMFSRVIALDKKEYKELCVCSGDTIWDYAREYGCNSKDIREVVWDICKLNNLEDAVIYPGQTLLIPLD